MSRNIAFIYKKSKKTDETKTGSCVRELRDFGLRTHKQTITAHRMTRNTLFLKTTAMLVASLGIHERALDTRLSCPFL